ncbi:MAG: WYL domain-containing protein [Deltaproteobacteria bacterium]|nr:WYL domain-containing protein [Deltaproteobacteria bacterium]
MADALPADLRLHDLELVAFDLEATGVAWGHDRIVELAALRFRFNRDGQVVPGPRWSTLVDPGQPIPEIVSRMTGIDAAVVAGAPPLEDVWSDLERALRGAVVVAHSVRSDLAWLGAEALRIGAAPLDATFYCTLEAARRVLPKAPRYTLPALAEHLALPTEVGFHRAMADALHTRNLLARCVQVAEATTVGELGWKEPAPWPDPDVYAVTVPERLTPLVDAVHRQERSGIVYRGGSGKHRRFKGFRPVTPLGFFAHEGVPYLRAWCHIDDAAKSFRCDRIARVHVGWPVPSGA